MVYPVRLFPRFCVLRERVVLVVCVPDALLSSAFTDTALFVVAAMQLYPVPNTKSAFAVAAMRKADSVPRFAKFPMLAVVAVADTAKHSAASPAVAPFLTAVYAEYVPEISPAIKGPAPGIAFTAPIAADTSASVRVYSWPVALAAIYVVATLTAALTAACAGVAVGVDEPMCYRVVITGLEVIEPCLGVVVVPTIAQRVDFCLGAGA